MSDGEAAERGEAGGVTVSSVRPSEEVTVALISNVPGMGTETKPHIAGYDLVRAIGKGGMGVVWEATEHRFDRPVAVKVHTQEMRASAEKDELWAEAFVAARIPDPGIVRVLDVGYTLDEQPYYTMELVEGSDLATLLADGPLAPRRALDIAADIARAVAAAHEHGVIHRDLKPRNIIIDASGRARVLDFGIALNVHGTDRYEGLVTGSPAYMAPEQALGEKIVPQTDIFAIGVVLYQMLTGERPFTGGTTAELLAAIASQSPAPPSARNPKLHEDLDAVVLRCLAKKPEDRFSSARTLFETLQAVAEGRTVDLAPLSARKLGPARMSSHPPKDRPKKEDAKKHLSWTWKLASSPEALWPFVANTDRFNRAVGLAPVAFTDEPAPVGGTTRTGEMRVMGMALKWREYPFEWIKEREHSVFRWYSSGPVAAVWNRVKLTPMEGGGCQLEHDIWMTPRGMIGQLAAFVEATKLGTSIDRFYRHLDEVLVAGGHVDPFEPLHTASPDARSAVERGCAALHEAGFSSAVIEKLAMHLLSTPDGVLRTIRPYEMADAWGTERSETLDVMIHAAHEHLLEPSWDVFCPKCLVPHESVRDLGSVKRHGHCKACATMFERDLSETVELVFTPHPNLRKVDNLTYCAGAPALRPHILAQQVLDPGEERTIKVNMPRGRYRVAGAVARTSADVVASAVGFATEAEATANGDRVEARPAIVRAGEVTFVLRNPNDHEETIRIEVPGARSDGVPAAAAMTHPIFKALYDQQLLARGELLPVSQLAFLFVEMRDRPALFLELGDTEACAEVTRLDDIVREIAHEQDGTVVPSSLDLLVVAFSSSVRALQAGLTIRARLDKEIFASPIVMSCHDGRCIALTREGKAEFFGETLHRGQSLLDACPARGIALSASFAADRTIAIAIHESGMKITIGTSQSGPYAGRRVTLLSPP